MKRGLEKFQVDNERVRSRYLLAQHARIQLSPNALWVHLCSGASCRTCVLRSFLYVTNITYDTQRGSILFFFSLIHWNAANLCNANALSNVSPPRVRKIWSPTLNIIDKWRQKWSVSDYWREFDKMQIYFPKRVSKYANRHALDTLHLKTEIYAVKIIDVIRIFALCKINEKARQTTDDWLFLGWLMFCFAVLLIETCNSCFQKMSLKIQIIYT